MDISLFILNVCKLHVLKPSRLWMPLQVLSKRMGYPMNFWSNFEPGTQSPKRVKRTGLKFDILWVIEELFPLVKCISDQRIFACQLIVTMRSMS